MNRWNIKDIFFLGANGERREISFKPDSVNVITGASGTGKSTLIKAIDYCLGSKDCELPAHVKRRCIAVGVKWVRGESELLVGRIVPAVGQITSTQMFCTTGRGLRLPTRVQDFEGAAPVGSAKRFVESVFGIDDIDVTSEETRDSKGRATVRHVTPYLFVTKEVIYSESVLLHGLEDPDKAPDILATMPYFLGVVNQETAKDLQRLRGLERALEREEARVSARARIESDVKQRALSLLSEARRLGLSGFVGETASESALVDELRRISEGGAPTPGDQSDEDLWVLTDRRQAIVGQLTDLRQQSRAAKVAIRDAEGAGTAVARQRGKLQLAEHLKLDAIPNVCPVCASPSDLARQSATDILQTLVVIRAESAAIDKVRPTFIEHSQRLESMIVKQNAELRSIDSQIAGLIQASEASRALATRAQAQAHILGRISFFLETIGFPNAVSSSLDTLRQAVDELSARIDKDARDLRLRIAESKVSDFASVAFELLPTVAPCVGSRLFFNSRKPEVTVIESGSSALLKMTDVGSDQNYLAIHIALSFALQHQFEDVKSSVPGVLVFDQISRPYFPTKSEKEERDEAEIVGGEEDDDILAMRKHVDFLFKETAQRDGLQVILIEHAYFADDPRYVEATQERWTKRSGKALIPLDWSVRPDVGLPTSVDLENKSELKRRHV